MITMPSWMSGLLSVVISVLVAFAVVYSPDGLGLLPDGQSSWLPTIATITGNFLFVFFLLGFVVAALVAIGTILFEHNPDADDVLKREIRRAIKEEGTDSVLKKVI